MTPDPLSPSRPQRRRFVEQPDGLDQILTVPDFRFRNHAPRRPWLVASIIGLSLVLAVLVEALVADRAVGGALRTTIATLLAVFLVIVFYRLYHRLSLAEFLNMALSAALRSGVSFCAILRQNGNLLYCDPRLVDLAGRRLVTIDDLLDDPTMDPSAATAIRRCLAERKPASFDLVVSSSNGSHGPFRTEVTPLERPSGHFVLRAW